MVNNILPEEIIQQKILLIRDKKVMLDSDLAELYDVKTKELNLAVKRNFERFPEDFMFKLSKKEFNNLRLQFETSSWGGRRTAPYVFTELGVSMLSSVLKSKKAVQINMQIMRIFIKLKEIMLNYKDLAQKIEELEVKNNKQFKSIFDAIKLLMHENHKIKQRLSDDETKKKTKKFGFVKE